MEHVLRIAAVSLALAGVLLTGGCGNKGPLFIPEPPPETQEAAAPAPAGQ